MKRYTVEVKYKTFVVSTIILDADSESEAAERILTNLNMDELEEFELMSIVETEMPTVEGPSTIQ